MKKSLFNSAPSTLWQSKIRRQFNLFIKDRYDCLDHFAVNLIFNSQSTINICSNSEYIRTYSSMSMYKYSSGLYLGLVDSLPVIPWRLLVHNNDGYRLYKYISFKEVLHKLYSGLSFVYKMDNWYLNVAVASNSKDPKHAITFLNHAEEILNIWGYFTDQFRLDLENDYNIKLPKLNEVILSDSAFSKLEVFSRDWADNNMFIYRDCLKNV